MILLFFVLLAGFLDAALPQKVMICGVCRDVEKRLPSTIQIIEEIGALFDDYRVIVYENNSIDDTKAVLKKWEEENPRLFVISEDVREDVLKTLIINLKEGHFFRPEEIARARNIVLDKAMSPDYEEYPYLIWMDLDFKIPPAIEGIREAFTTSREWDAIFAYGIDPPGTFWDWYAFRDQSSPLGSELLGNDWWYMPKNLKLRQGDDWHPVYSAFGGCGIYKKSSIQGCRYSAVVTKDLATLSRKLIEEGRKNHHPHVKLYMSQMKELTGIVKINKPVPGLPSIENPHVGIVINDDFPPVVFKMSSFTYQYPSVCEHVPFHATMIVNGHGKLFINPRMIFHYGG